MQSESIFRLELDRLDRGVGALARLPGVISAASVAGNDNGADGERNTILVKLVLVDDGALGPVVSALAGLDAHIVSLQKSEPSLEDVFVELVGRGFEDDLTVHQNGTGLRSAGSRPADEESVAEELAGRSR